jgi:hypothetical protein
VIRLTMGLPEALSCAHWLREGMMSWWSAFEGGAAAKKEFASIVEGGVE